MSGTPQTGRKGVSCDCILQAAAEEFAEKGYGGARVDEIARRAGVNKATLYYRIGDKDELYQAVLDRVLGQTADQVCAAVGNTNGCEEKIRHFVTIIARNTKEMGCTAPIMMREVASGGSHLPEVALRHMGRLLGVLDSALEEGVSRGIFRPVNSFMVHMMVIGSIMFYATNEPIRRRNAENNPGIYCPDHFLTMEQAAAEISDLVLAAIQTQHDYADREARQ